MLSKIKHKVLILGIACMGVLAFSGIAAGSALALEFVPAGGAAFPIPFSSRNIGPPPVLRTAGGSEVKCERDRDAGFLLNSTEDEDIVRFKECELVVPAVGNCENQGAGSREIRTADLHSKLVVLEEVGGVVTKFGIELTPAAPGVPLAEFECLGAIPVVVTGGVVGEITAPALGVNSNTFTLNFAEVGGVQQWGPPFLETSILGGAPEQSVEITEDEVELGFGVEGKFKE